MFTITINPEELEHVVVEHKLLKLYHDAIKAGKEKDFIDQLYVIIMNSPVVEKQMEEEAEAKKRAKEARKARILAWEQYLESLPIDEWAKVINTPFKDLPPEIQDMYPYEVPKYKESFDDFCMLGRVKKNSRQQEIFGSRFVKYLEMNGFVTSDSNGTHIHYDRVARDVNEHMVQYDLPATKTHRAQYVRVSAAAIKDYCTKLTTPKRSRFSGIAQALNIPEVYLAGYLKWNFNKDGTPVPINKAA